MEPSKDLAQAEQELKCCANPLGLEAGAGGGSGGPVSAPPGGCWEVILEHSLAV